VAAHQSTSSFPHRIKNFLALQIPPSPMHAQISFQNIQEQVEHFSAESVQYYIMRNKIPGMTAIAGLAVAASIWFLSVRAQETQRGQAARTITTNWLGCVVVGKPDSVDAIGQGPFPQCAQQFQLGLRSDGVVVWRSSK
jgi:hypothetical protein